MKEIIEKLAKFENLSGVEMTDVIERIVTGRVTEAQIASLLLALKMKGETPEERTAIAQVMRGHAQHIPTEIHDAMDNCGTCLLYTSPSPRDLSTSRMPSSA